MAKTKAVAQQSFLEELTRPDPVIEPGGVSIGATLKAARLKNGSMSIDEIAREICAWPYHIKAIENDQFDLLPGSTYAVGFIRSYANYFKLDAGQLVRRFKDEMSSEPPAPAVVFLESLDGPRMPKWAMAATIAVLVAGTYMTWLGTIRESSPVLSTTATSAFAAQAATVSQNTKDAVKSVPALVVVSHAKPDKSSAVLAGAPGAVAQPRQLRPVPVSTSPSLQVKSSSRAQKSVDASAVSRKREESYARLSLPVNNELFNKALPAAAGHDSSGVGRLILTAGSAGALDLVLKDVNTVVEGATPLDTPSGGDGLFHY